MRIAAQHLAELIAFGREQRGVEFKGPGKRSDKAFFAKVVRGVIAMANRRDGGVVVIGVDEVDGSLVTTGLTSEEAATWGHDEVGDSLVRFVDPPVSFLCELVDLNDDTFTVINVETFEQVPILCKRDYQRILRDGACYVRSRRKPESIEIPSHHEMRELVDLAVDKELRRFLHRAAQAGLLTPSTTPPPG